MYKYFTYKQNLSKTNIQTHFSMMCEINNTENHLNQNSFL